MFHIYLMESILLVTSLTTDAFTAGLSYGANKIKIPKTSLVVISAFCSFMLLVSLFFGKIFSNMIDMQFAKYICFLILFLLGFSRIFDLVLKSYINKFDKINLHFSVLDFKFILTVYADAKLADVDNSKTLSIKESIALSLALSLDGIAIGFGVALSSFNIIVPVLLSLVFTAFAVKLGEYIGLKTQKKVPFDLSYLSGVLLIILAFLKI